MVFNLNVAIRNLAFFLLLIYHVQLVLLSLGYSLLKIPIFIYLIIGMLIFIKVLLSDFDRIIIQSFSLFIFLQIIYFVISDRIVFSPKNIEYKSITDITKVLIVFFSFFISYFFTKNNKISPNFLKIIYIIVFIINIFLFYFNANVVMLEKEKDEITNNIGYAFVLLLPFLFFIKNKYLSIGLLFVSLFFVLISAKRGAIISGLLFTSYYVYKVYFKNSRSRVKDIFSTFFLFLMIAYFVFYIYLNSDFLQARFLASIGGNSSGRDIIYSNLWNEWFLSNNIITYIFGSGLLSSVASFGFYAHNDWLELLTSTGLLGFSIYLLIFYELYQFARFKTLDKNEKNVVNSFILIWFLKSLFSMGYSTIYMVFPFILIGFILGKQCWKNV